MATNLENLTVKVVVDSKGAEVGFVDVQKGAIGLNGALISLDKTTKIVEKDFNSLGKESQDSFKKMSGAGFTAKQAVSAVVGPLLAVQSAVFLFKEAMTALNAATKSTVGAFLSLETAVAKINTVVETAQLGTVDFGEEILKLQSLFGTGVEESGKAFYETLASGSADAAGSVKLLAVAQKLAIGGVTTLDTAMSGIISVMNGYNLAADDAAKISDSLFIAAAGGRTDIRSLATDIGRVAGLAKESGVSMEDLLAQVSAVTLVIPSTSEAISAYRGVVSALLTPTEQLKELYKKLGIESASATISQEGLPSVLKKISNASGNSVDALAILLGRIEAIPAALALSGGNTAKAADQMAADIRKSFTNAGAVTEEKFAFIAATGAFQIQQLQGAIATSLTKIGQVFSTAFGPIAATVAEAINGVTKFIDDLTRRILSIDFSGIGSELMQTAKTIGTVTIAVTGLGVAIATLMTGQTLLILQSLGSSLLLIGKAAIAAVAPFALIAVKVVAITAAVLALVAAIDIVARNTDKFGQLFSVTMQAINLAIFKTIEVILGGFASALKAIGAEQFGEKIARQADLATKRVQESQAKLSKKSEGIDFGIGGKVFSEISKFFAESPVKLDKVGQAAKKADEVTKGKGGLFDPDAAKKAADALKAMEDSLKRLQDIGASLSFDLASPDATDAERTYQAGLRMIELEKSRAMLGGLSARAADELAGKMINQLGINKQLQEGAKITADIYAEQKKNIEDSNVLLNKLNDDNIAKSMEIASIGATQQQVIESQLRAEMDKIDLLEEQLKLKSKDGKLNSEAVKQLQAARDLAEQNAATKSAQAAGPMGIGTANEAVQSAIGASSGVGVFMSAAEAIVGAVQKLIDFIPNILNAVAKVFSSLAELPIMIMKAVMNVIQSAAKLISEFIPNLLQMVPDLIDAVLTAAFETLPQAAQVLFNKLPELIDKFSQRIPDLVEKAVKGIVANASLIAIGLIDALVKGAPKFLSPEFGIKLTIMITKALISGFIKGVQSIGDSIVNLFKGIGPVFSQAGKGLVEGISAATEKITGIGSQLFQVSETGPGAAARDKAKELVAQIDAAGRGAFGWLMKAWEAIKSVWRDYIFPLVKMLLIDPLKALWDVALSAFNLAVGLFKGAWDLGVAAFNATLQVFSLLWEGIKVGFALIWNTGKAMFDAVVGTFQVLWEFAKGVFKDPIEAFKGLIIGLSNVFGSLGAKILEAFQPVMNFFSGAFDTVKNIGSNILGSAASFGAAVVSAMGDFGDKIATPIKNLLAKIINPVIDTLNALKLPAFRFTLKTPPGFDNIDVTVWNELDLIKGNIAKLNQGGPVPGSGFTDNQPALLTPGEFVMNRNAVRDIGLGNLERMNRTGQGMGGNTANVSVNLTVNTEQPIDERFIKTKLVPTLLDEVRRESLRGAFVLSGRGIK